jgi:hypothetical protein
LQAGNGATDARDSNFMVLMLVAQHMHLIQISLVRVLVNQQHMHLIQILVSKLVLVHLLLTQISWY